VVFFVSFVTFMFFLARAHLFALAWGHFSNNVNPSRHSRRRLAFGAGYLPSMLKAYSLLLPLPSTPDLAYPDPQ
jgi:hypothetical protein